MPRPTAAILTSAMLLVIATGCLVEPPHTPSPITKEAATARAIDLFPSSEPVTVLSVRLTTIGDAMEGTGAVDKSAPAWALRLSGSFYDAIQCGPVQISPPQCPPHATTVLVVIAVHSGEIWGEMPPP